jgi:thiol-disulfide isomerase/thioredoxin
MGKVVVINFWGTWCGPCVIEMPELQEFADRFRADPEVLLLTINNDEDPDEVREWMAEREYDFTVLLDDGYVMESGVRVWPTTWFIDREGRIVFEQVGASAALLEEFTWRVEALKGGSED